MASRPATRCTAAPTAPACRARKACATVPRKQVRYAVVGLGHIAQVAVLPAFGNARRNSRLAALVSGDPVKLEELGAKYHVERRYSYERYDEMLKSGDVDAV